MRRLLFIFAAIAGMCALGLGVLHFGVVQQAIGERALRSAGPAGASSSLEGFSFNLLLGRVYASRLVLRSRPDSPPWLDATHLDVSFDLGELVRGRPQAKRLAVGAATLHLVRGKRGEWNLPAGPQGSAPLDLGKLLPANASVESLALVVDDTSSNLHAAAPALSLSLGPGKNFSERTLSIRPAQAWNVRYGDFQGSFRLSPLNLTLGADSATLEATSAATPLGDARLSGKFVSVSQAKYEAALELSGSLPKALRAVGMKTGDTGGGFRAKFRIHGEKALWRAEVESSGDSVRIDPLPPLQIRIAAAAAADQPQWTVRRFEAISAEGRVTAQGEIAAPGSKSDTRLQGDAVIVDPPQIGRRFGLKIPIAARAVMQWRLRFPARLWKQAEGQVEVELRHNSAIHSGLPIDAALRVGIHPEALSADVQSLSLAGAQSAGRLTLRRADAQVEGSWAGTAPDLPAFLLALGVPAAGLPSAGEGNWSALISGPVTGLRFDGGLAVRRVRVGLFDGLAAQSKAKYEAGVLSFSEGGVRWADQHAEFSASLDFRPAVTTLLLDVSSRPLDIPALVRAAGTDSPLSGKASFILHAEGQANRPDGHIRVDGSSLEFAGQALGDLRAEATLRGGTLTVAPFQLSGPGAKGQGSLELSTGRYRVDLEAREWPLSPIPLPGKAAVSGKVSLAVRGEGTLDHPSLDATIRSPGITAAGSDLGPVEATLRLRGQNVEAHAAASSLGVEGDGRLQAASPFPADFTLRWKSLDLARFGLPTTTSLDGSLRARIPLEHARNGEGELRLERVELAAAGETFRNQEPVAAKLAGEKLTIESARMAWREATFSLGGVLPGGLQVQGQAPLSLLSRFLPADGVALQGSAEVEGTVTGTYDKPSIHARVITRDAVFEDPAARWNGRLRAQADLSADSLTIEGLRASIEAQELDFKVRDLAFRETDATRLTLEKGILRLDHVALEGPNTSVRAQGSVNILANNALDVQVEGAFDTALLTPVRSNFAFAGPAKARLAVSGTWDAPQAHGALTLENGTVRLAAPPIEASAVNADISFAERNVELKRLTASVNGGRIDIKGRAARDGSRGNLELQCDAQGIYLDYPKGFKTVSSGQLTFVSDGEFHRLSGKVQVIDGGYREALTLGSLAPPATVDRQTAPSFLDRIRLDVAVSTLFPVGIDNNIAVAEMSANLRVVGTASEPSVTGRLEVEPGGRIYALEQEFRVDHASVGFINENRIEPILDIQATARVGQYDVVLRSSGGFDNLQNTFSSYPQLTESQIESLLITGSPDNANKVATGSLAQRSAVSIFGSSLTGGFTSRIRRLTGVSEVRIEPGLVSTESNPSARLTVGQHLTENLRIVYSSSLTESTDQIWFTEYDWRRRFQARVTRQEDNTYRSEMRQLFEFGGGQKTGDPRRGLKRGKVRIGSIEFQGDLLFPEAQLRKKLKLKPGASYDFIKAQDKLDKLARFYADHGYLEARIRAERGRATLSSLDLVIQVHPGLPVQLSFEGFDYPGSTRKRVVRSWQDGIIDAQRTGGATDALRRHLFREGYPDATVTASVQLLDGKKRVVFETTTGDRVGKPSLVFEGISSADASAIRTQLKDSNLEEEAITQPEPLRQAVQSYFLDHGYLGATAEPPILRRSESGRPQTVVVVRPGPAFRIDRVQFEGLGALDGNRLRAVLPVAPGARYNPADRPLWTRSILQEYWKDGYRDAVVRTELKPNLEKSTLDVVFRLTENRRSVIAGVSVEGNYATSEQYVRDRVTLREGEPADTDKLNQSRKNLLDSLAFNLVDLKAEAAKPEQAPPGLPAGAQPLWLDVTVREPKPYRFDLGVYYDTGRGTGVVTDVSRTNLFGGARTLGIRTLIDPKRQELRTYYSQPYLFRYRIESTGALTVSTDDTNNMYRVRELELSLQQTAWFRNRRWILNYGYRYQWAKVSPDSELQIAPFTGSTSPLFSTISHDTRNNVLDASRGHFISNAYEYSPRQLGGSLTYQKYYGQLFKYFGLTRPAPTPFSVEPRSRVVYATGLRIGVIGQPPNQAYLPTDAFLAGGGTTIRGYPYNSIGLVSGQGNVESEYTLGGKATLILNNELRFPLWRFLDGVTFFDTGNVWATPSEMSLTDLRSSSGIGIRVRNPFVVLRFDYGWIIGRRPGEPAGGFYFSIGQIF